MKVLVTGVAGQLGHDVVKELVSRGVETVGSDIFPACETEADYISLDITDEDAVQQTIRACGPDAIIHCAAWTAVDAAEEEGRDRQSGKAGVKRAFASGTNGQGLGYTVEPDQAGRREAVDRQRAGCQRAEGHQRRLYRHEVAQGSVQMGCKLPVFLAAKAVADSIHIQSTSTHITIRFIFNLQLSC